MDFHQQLTWLRGQALSYSPDLNRACEQHCDYMAAIGQIFHSPFFNGGECIALINLCPNEDAVCVVFQAWERSDKHRAILTAAGNEYGVFFLVTNNRVYATFRLL